MSNLAKRFALLVEAKQKLAQQTILLNKLIADTGQQLYNELTDSGLTHIRVQGAVDGKNVFADGKDRIVSPDIINRPNVAETNRTQFLAWMEKNDFGALIKRSIAPKTLQSWVDQRIEKNLPLPPKTLMTVFAEETAKVRRAEARKP